MKNFLKGFALGFGLLFFLILGVILTRAYDLITISPKNLSYVFIEAKELDADKLRVMVEKYSKLLNKTCTVENIYASEVGESSEAQEQKVIKAIKLQPAKKIVEESDAAGDNDEAVAESSEAGNSDAAGSDDAAGDSDEAVANSDEASLKIAKAASKANGEEAQTEQPASSAAASTKPASTLFKRINLLCSPL